MSAHNTDTPRGELTSDPDAAIRQLARSRLHYALDALRQQLQEHDELARR